jgi:hypothetical protein
MALRGRVRRLDRPRFDRSIEPFGRLRATAGRAFPAVGVFVVERCFRGVEGCVDVLGA